MKKILLFAVFATSALTTSAQDILVYKNGDVESVEILEVSPTEVKYKKSNHENNTIFIEKRSKLHSIKYQDGNVQKFNNTFKSNNSYSYYSDYGKKKRFKHELDIYVQNGWGLGYKFREEFNPYVGVNFLNTSFMSNFHDITRFGMVNVRLFGLRLNSPSFEKIRAYTELNIGYTFSYFNVELYNLFYDTSYDIVYIDKDDYKFKEHFFGLDFSTGIQLHKNFAIGYNLNFFKNGNWKGMSHWGKLSFIF